MLNNKLIHVMKQYLPFVSGTHEGYAIHTFKSIHCVKGTEYDPAATLVYVLNAFCVVLGQFYRSQYRKYFCVGHYFLK